MGLKACEHEVFSALVAVNRIEDIGRFVAEVTIFCVGCGKKFQFAGIEPGFNYNAPTVSLDGLEANLPIFPEGERPNPLQVLGGYTVKGHN